MKNDLEHLQSPFLDEAINPGGAPRGWDPEQPGDDEAEGLLAHECHAGCTHELEAEHGSEDEAGDDEAPGCCGGPVSAEFEAELFDREAWSHSAEQLAFRDRVLAVHLARSRKSRGQPQRDLGADELDTVPSGGVPMRTDAAAAAGRLLAAAQADLARAQQAGDADAQLTLRLGATSGYRARDHQHKLWLRYFPGYYKRTRAVREGLAGGPHGDEALAYLLRPKADGGFGLGGRIAAPGYSNHQNGIAIDFLQERRKGHEIENDSGEAYRARWRASWFHHWLKSHAAEHGFQPLATEEWHWEFRQAGARPPATRPDKARVELPVSVPPAPRGQAVPHQGGKLWTFQATVHDTPVAVFCPPAALGQGEVDVLVYAHGLLGGCDRPKSVPDGLIAGGPFRLGAVVTRSARPVVLVVPLLDWRHTGGEAVFGRAHPRWHPLGHPARLNALVEQVLAEVGRVQSSRAPALARLLVAGHSRAYDFLEPLAQLHADPQMEQGALARLAEVWSLDATYSGSLRSWRAWLAAKPGLRVTVIYRPGTKTAAVGDAFWSQRGGRLRVLHAREGHCEVPGHRLPALLGAVAAVQPEMEAGDDEFEAFAEEFLDELDSFEAAPDAAAEGEDEDEAVYVPEDEFEADDEFEQLAEDETSDTLGEWSEEHWNEEADHEFEDEADAEQPPEEEETGTRTPMALPLDNPVPFAPLPPPGSYWPVRTRHRAGRLVSYMYQAPSGIVGLPGYIFLASRKGRQGGRIVSRWHAGLDLFAHRGDEVVACEDGKIVNFSRFYKARSGQQTYKLLIQHKASGVVVNYGELRGDSLRRHGLAVGMPVSAGQVIGNVSDTDMLHFETYVKGTEDSHRWWKADRDPPHELLNPTRYLLALARSGLPAATSPAGHHGPVGHTAPAVQAAPTGRQPTLAGMDSGLTPPSDPSAYRSFRLTTYHAVVQDSMPAGGVQVPILDEQGATIATGSPAFFARLALEGTGRLSDGRLVNVVGKKVLPVLHDTYEAVLAHHRRAYAKRDARRAEQGRKPVSTRYSGIVTEGDLVVGVLAFHVVPTSRVGVGYGMSHGVAYTPFRTLAADIGDIHSDKVDPRWKGKGGLVPVGTRVYIKECDGLRLPDGSTHDGWFVVNDTGGAIFGAHFDMFTGTDALGRRVKLPALGQVWFPGIEQRMPAGYTRGLKR